MKHLVLMLVMMVAFTMQAKPILAKADIGSIEMMQVDSDQAIVQNAVVAEAPAEENGWLSQAINFILLIVSTIFTGLWLKVRSKIKDVGELFLMAHEYTDDNKLSETERTNLINKFYKIIGKDPQLE